MGHVGARVSALIDGQLSPAEAERLWAHVHQCGLCRARVEREGWVKTQLAGLALLPAAAGAPGTQRRAAGVAAEWPPGPPAACRTARPPPHDDLRRHRRGLDRRGHGRARDVGAGPDTRCRPPRTATSLTQPSESPTGTAGPSAPAPPGPGRRWPSPQGEPNRERPAPDMTSPARALAASRPTSSTRSTSASRRLRARPVRLAARPSAVVLRPAAGQPSPVSPGGPAAQAGPQPYALRPAYPVAAAPKTAKSRASTGSLLLVCRWPC